MSLCNGERSPLLCARRKSEDTALQEQPHEVGFRIIDAIIVSFVVTSAVTSSKNSATKNVERFRMFSTPGSC